MQERELATLQSLLRGVQAQHDALHRRFAADCQLAAAGLQQADAALRLELASAGNVWLEHAQPGSSWLPACLEALGSMARSQAGSCSAQPAVRLVAAARIHNRCLRAHASQQSGGRDGVQHLAYAAPQHLPGGACCCSASLTDRM
jgi:hypothetical protein